MSMSGRMSTRRHSERATCSPFGRALGTWISLDDVIAMKRAAGRPKDLLAIEHLAALRDEIDRRG